MRSQQADRAHNRLVEPVSVAVLGSRVEAELLVGMLRNNGIQATMSADDAGGVDPALEAQGVRVLVPGAQAAKARRLVDGRTGRDSRLNGVQRWIVRLLGGRGGDA